MSSTFRQGAAVLLTGLALVGLARATRTGAEPEPKPTPADPDPFQTVTLRGRVVEYRPALERAFGIALVDEWAKDLLALATEDGRLLPILPTDGARLFYQDRRTWNRPMELTARVHDRTPGLQVVLVHSINGGRRNEIYYWCDICSIRMYQLKDCECCQGPIELREHPVGEPFRVRNDASSPTTGKREGP